MKLLHMEIEIDRYRHTPTNTHIYIYIYYIYILYIYIYVLYIYTHIHIHIYMYTSKQLHLWYRGVVLRVNPNPNLVGAVLLAGGGGGDAAVQKRSVHTSKQIHLWYRGVVLRVVVCGVVLVACCCSWVKPRRRRRSCTENKCAYRKVVDWVRSRRARRVYYTTSLVYETEMKAAGALKSICSSWEWPVSLPYVLSLLVWPVSLCILRNKLLVAELWLRLRLAAAPLLCWLNACCGLWMTACDVPALLTHDPKACGWPLPWCLHGASEWMRLAL